jgi:hypothetical protein
MTIFLDKGRENDYTRRNMSFFDSIQDHRPPDPQPRGIEPIPARPISMRILPDHVTSHLRVVYTPVGAVRELWRDATIWVDTRVTMARWVVALLRLYMQLAPVIDSQQKTGGKMATLIMVLKVLKLVGVAVGTGGFLVGLLAPETAALIAGASYVAFNAVYFAADWLDNKKLDKSVDV